MLLFTTLLYLEVQALAITRDFFTATIEFTKTNHISKATTLVHSGLQGNLGKWRRDVFGSRLDRMAAGGFQQYV